MKYMIKSKIISKDHTLSCGTTIYWRGFIPWIDRSTGLPWSWSQNISKAKIFSSRHSAEKETVAHCLNQYNVPVQIIKVDEKKVFEHRLKG